MERFHGSSRRQSMLGLCVGLLAAACENTAPNGWVTPDPPPGAGAPGFAGAPSFAGTTSFAGATSFAGTTSFAGGGSFSGGGSIGVHLVVPTDNRPVVTAETPPPPLSGGTLSTTADGAYLVAADPERDHVLFVDIATRLVTGDFPLTPGDEPGRLLAGPGQQMFVALRRGGAVVTFDPELGEVARRSACLAPRGLAYDTSSDALHVACADGKLVTFTGTATEPTRVLDLDTDLRDVLVSEGRLWVTRMRSAELIEIGSDGTILQRLKPPTLIGTVPAQPPVDGFAGTGNVSASSNFSPAVAWRTVRGPDGTLHMLHQRGQDNDVGLGHHGDDDNGNAGNNGAIFQPDPYGGGGNPCGSIVRNGITKFSPDSSIVTELAPSLPLTVDIAISPSG
ncbi:MAG TPA: hypothetical protein VHO25_14735, partial [Polyangiaceae bacterium]|nr:hypothetical protein [Polyangiaceae bacterium]